MKEFELYFENFLNAAPLVFGGFGLAFIITHLAIPSIVRVAQAKMLYSMPNGRSSHTKATPVLGGIAIFAGLIISTIIFSAQGFGYELKYIIAGLIIIFFFGIKDDILMLDPKKKLAAQVVAALLIAMLGDVRITNFHGFLGIGDVNYIISICCTVFLFIVLTNGFNLIDGIDGLASGVGIITSVTFGSWFLMAGHSSYAVMSFSLTGALLAFFYFNVFGKQNKIFLGDTGSLILGFSMTVLAIRFLEYKQNSTGLLIVESIPAVTFGILIVPLFDTLRVFTLRIIQKKSPFHADKQHIHHRLLFLGFTHLKATVIILFFNYLFIGLSIGLQQIGSLNLILVQLTLASVLSFYIMRKVHRKKNQIQRK
jgi:UDP-GlcNAc:undecaprenyl-phosphate GlcNAc-1-phosphate transferase